MACAKCISPEEVIVDRVEGLLRDVLAVSVDDLEAIVRLAHECSFDQKHDPPERFAVSRQALRMFWHFRRSLDAVTPFVADEV